MYRLYDLAPQKKELPMQTHQRGCQKTLVWLETEDTWWTTNRTHRVPERV